MIEMAKMSSKGQVVIPASIREELKLEEGTRLVVQRIGNSVVFKRINIEDALKEYEKLAARGEQQRKKLGIENEGEINKIIHERRKKTRIESSARY